MLSGAGEHEQVLFPKCWVPRAVFSACGLDVDIWSEGSRTRDVDLGACACGDDLELGEVHCGYSLDTK